MRRKRPDPLLIIVLFVGLGLIVTVVSMEFRLPNLISASTYEPSSRLVTDDAR